MKKQIAKKIGDIGTYDLDGLFFEEIVELLKDRMPEGSQLDYVYGDGSFDIMLKREETDLEYSTRIVAENMTKNKLEEREKETLRQLKEKYEN